MTAARTIQIINRLNDPIIVQGPHDDLSGEKQPPESGFSRLTIPAKTSQEIPRDNVTHGSSEKSKMSMTRRRRDCAAIFQLRFCVPNWEASSSDTNHNDTSSDLTAVPGRHSAPVFSVTAPWSSSVKTKRQGNWQVAAVSRVSGDEAQDCLPDRVTALLCTTPTTTTLLLLPTQPPSNFMSRLPDTQPLSSMCIPGTHETFARYGWPISQCQEESSTIAKQLNDGIRFMDFRVRPDGEPGQERLWAFHGSRPQRIELGQALDQVYEWLDGVGCKETLIISLKPEQGDAIQMQRLLFDLYITPCKQRWWLSPNFPSSLGEARGKLILFSRFGQSDSQPGGVHPPIWPDNHEGTFAYSLPNGQVVNTQDWYNIGCWRFIPHKFDLVMQLLKESGSQEDVFALNFISCAQFPLATPPVTAKGWWESGPNLFKVQGMNSRLRDLVAHTIGEDSSRNHVAQKPIRVGNAAIPGLQACFAIDFYDYQGAPELIQLLIQANFTQ